MVENFRPGVMDRLGLGYEEVSARNPRVVYCSITGFGSGAGAALPGYDLLLQALGGLMSITGEPDGEPQKVGVALVDVLAGLFATVGILAALRHRDRTGEGQRVEIDLLSSLLAALVNQASAHTLAGAVPARMGNAHPSIAPYELYPTGDGELVLAVGNDRQFARLCETLGAPGLAADPRFAANADRVGARAELRAELERAARRPRRARVGRGAQRRRGPGRHRQRRRRGVRARRPARARAGGRDPPAAGRRGAAGPEPDPALRDPGQLPRRPARPARGTARPGPRSAGRGGPSCRRDRGSRSRSHKGAPRAAR